MEVIALVKHDCETCATLAPALEAAAIAGAPVRMVSQSNEAETRAFAERVGLTTVPELDQGLALSERFDPDGGAGRGAARGRRGARPRRGPAPRAPRGAVRGRGRHAAARRPAGDPPGCTSITRDPDVAAPPGRQARPRRRPHPSRASSSSARSRTRSRRSTQRGLTDGLPVVPPTPERVVALLEHTSRDSQDLVGDVPPYGGEATVEKVAINAVMAGCAGPELPIVLAAVQAACREAFALHGLIATTQPAGPLVIVSGPYAEEAGMNARGNALGQGNRANSTIGRALQLVARNVGGGRPGARTAPPTASPARSVPPSPSGWRTRPSTAWPRTAACPPDETGVTLFAAEAPRLLVDQLAREPEGLCASLATALEHVAHPKQRLALDALWSCSAPSTAHLPRGRLGPRPRARGLLRAHGQPGARHRARRRRLARGRRGALRHRPGHAGGKFAAPDRILLAYAGGDAGLFSMVFGGGRPARSAPRPRASRVEPWR